MTTTTVPADGERFYQQTFSILGILLLVRIVYLLALYPADLYPDEAQYWAWAQAPAFGYYSKPPLIAWAIAATTAVCGNAEGCVRLSSPLFLYGAALFVVGIGRRLFTPRVGAWAGIVFATLPGVSVSSVVASTDAPLLFFWAGALYALVRLLDEDRARWWALLGACVGLGMLAKYAMGFFVLSAVLAIIFDRRGRACLASWGGLAALVLAVLIFVPNVVWNAEHAFVTLSHTEANADLGRSFFHPAAFVAFVFSQFGVFGPILFAVLLWLGIFRARLIVSEPYRLLTLFAAPPLLLMIVLSVLSRANANWAATTYVAGTVLVTAFLFKVRSRVLVRASVALHVGAAVVAFALVSWAVHRPDALPAWGDPLKRLRSWHQYGAAVSEIAAHVAHTGYLFEDRPELTEMLYYGRPRPVVVWKWHPGPAIRDHFDLTRDVKNAPPGPLVLVTSAENPSYILSRFEHSEPLGDIRQVLGRGRVRTERLYLVEGFKGYAD